MKTNKNNKHPTRIMLNNLLIGSLTILAIGTVSYLLLFALMLII